MGKITVLRLGHRFFRDSRVTTHVCLTARAFGACGVVIADRLDKEVEATVRDVVKRFGGRFEVTSGVGWRQAIREWKRSGGRIVHLTVYGLPLPEVIGEIRREPGDLLVVVGSEKVPGDVFRLADWNVSVTNQPMSEVAALAVFLDWLGEHREFELEYRDAETVIVPSARGKIVRGKARKVAGLGS
jgi:tRNA (cytidine56-2'-O)-methyltransferase